MSDEVFIISYIMIYNRMNKVHINLYILVNIDCKS